MSSSLKPQVLSMYRNLIRGAFGFHDYNFRSYALRRTQEQFRANAGVTDAKEVAVLLKKAEQQLGLVRRQSIVNSLYASYDHALTDPASRLSKSLS